MKKRRIAVRLKNKPSRREMDWLTTLAPDNVALYVDEPGLIGKASARDEFGFKAPPIPCDVYCIFEDGNGFSTRQHIGKGLFYGYYVFIKRIIGEDTNMAKVFDYGTRKFEYLSSNRYLLNLHTEMYGCNNVDEFIKRYEYTREELERLE